MEEFVVVRKVPGTNNDFEPVHPGHISEADAKRLKAALNATGMPCAIWTHDRWNREDDRIRKEVFCPECDQETVLCACEQNRENDDYDPGPPYKDSWARANNQ